MEFILPLLVVLVIPLTLIEVGAAVCSVVLPVALNTPQNSAEVSPKMLGVVNAVPSLVSAAAV